MGPAAVMRPENLTSISEEEMQRSFFFLNLQSRDFKTEGIRREAATNTFAKERMPCFAHPAIPRPGATQHSVRTAARIPRPALPPRRYPPSKAACPRLPPEQS